MDGGGRDAHSQFKLGEFLLLTKTSQLSNLSETNYLIWWVNGFPGNNLSGIYVIAKCKDKLSNEGNVSVQDMLLNIDISWN